MSIANPTNEELRQHYFRFPPDTAAHSRFPQFREVRFSAEQIRSLKELLGPRKTDLSAEWFEPHLLEPALHFPRSLHHQRAASASALERRFQIIQRAALSLLDALGVKSASPTTLPFELTPFLQNAATRYGREVGIPTDISREELHWNFWEAVKLPSVVAGISLLERWADMAAKEQRSFIERGRAKTRKLSNPGDQAFRVLIHGLAIAWSYWRGEQPGAGEEGPFIRFAATYIQYMRQQLGSGREDRAIYEELDRTSDSIRMQLRHYLRRMARGKRKSK